MRFAISLTIVLGMIFMGLTVAVADIPTSMNVQGRLTDSLGAPLPPGPRTFTFKIFNAAAGGFELWPIIPGEDQIIETDPSGLWNAEVGALIPIPDFVFTDTAQWLEITVDDGLGTLETLPRVKLLTTPSAFQSINASVSGMSLSAGPNSVNSVAIMDSAIAVEDIGRNGATTGQILKWNGTQWIASDDDTGGGVVADTDWVLTGNVLYTGGHWGLAQPGNILYGTHDSSHVNLGVACTTGTSGQNYLSATVGGGNSNLAGHDGATVAGGISNRSLGSMSTISGGAWNTTTREWATVSGGIGHLASQTAATVGGGQNNAATAPYATVGGGTGDTASGDVSTISGGIENIASGNYSSIGGGRVNSARGDWSTVPGGKGNAAAGNYSFAGGRRAIANHDGAFVWSDTSNTDFYSGADNEFAIKAAGGLRVEANNTVYGAEITNIANGDGLRLHANVSSGFAWGALYATNTGSSPTVSVYSGTGLAGYFSGDIDVTGIVLKSGGGTRIDHPLDPTMKYLNHSSVESPDMMNVYNGNIVTDANGAAVVSLPDYFEALNRDFRYQLTVIGQFAQAIVAEKIAGNRFAIRTDKPNVEVSWQVTGIRQDAFANANRSAVEQLKPAEDQGYYLHPKAHGQPESRSSILRLTKH